MQWDINSLLIDFSLQSVSWAEVPPAPVPTPEAPHFSSALSFWPAAGVAQDIIFLQLWATTIGIAAAAAAAASPIQARFPWLWKGNWNRRALGWMRLWLHHQASQVGSCRRQHIFLIDCPRLRPSYPRHTGSPIWHRIVFYRFCLSCPTWYGLVPFWLVSCMEWPCTGLNWHMYGMRPYWLMHAWQGHYISCVCGHKCGITTEEKSAGCF